MLPPESVKKLSQLFLVLITYFKLVFCNLMYFDLSMSPIKPSQPIPRLISSQSWCIRSASMVYPDGRGKLGMPENLYKNVNHYVLYQETSIELASKSSSCNEKMLACICI